YMITALEELNSSIADATLSYFNDLLYSGNNYVGNAAYIWDLCLVTYEQGTVATPIYNNMSQATLNKFNDLVRGKNSSTVGWNKFIGRLIMSILVIMARMFGIRKQELILQ